MRLLYKNVIKKTKLITNLMKIVSKLTLFLLNPESRERSPLTTANQVFYKTKNTAVKRLFFI